MVEVRFFPAGGARDRASGAVSGRAQFGYYWSSSSYEPAVGLGLRFDHGATYLNMAHRALGYSVRCVAQGELVATYCFNCSFLLRPESGSKYKIYNLCLQRAVGGVVINTYGAVRFAHLP